MRYAGPGQHGLMAHPMPGILRGRPRDVEKHLTNEPFPYVDLGLELTVLPLMAPHRYHNRLPAHTWGLPSSKQMPSPSLAAR
jgi:hypothetical protein